MKKLIPYLLLILAASACKKNSEPSPVPLISRVTVNGSIAYKFFYNSSDQITTWELYSYESPGNPLGAVFEFKYGSDGKLDELRSFHEPGHVPNSRILLQYDSLGRISGHEYYDLQAANPSKPKEWGVYQYNAASRLSTVTVKDENDKLEVRYNLSYYDDGSLKQRDSYEETITHQLRLTERVIYSLPLEVGIKGWEPITVIPLDGDEITRTVRYDGIQR